MTHFSEIFTANALLILRNLELRQPVENNVRLAPEIYFSWDDKRGKVALEMKSSAGHLADIWAKVSGDPRYVSFNISLGECSFNAGDVLGLIVDFEGCAGQTLPLMIRSALNGAMADTPFLDPLVGSEDRAVHTLLHAIRPQEALTGPAKHHTLIFQLPHKDFWLDIRDLRLFVIPAARRLLGHQGAV